MSSGASGPDAASGGAPGIAAADDARCTVAARWSPRIDAQRRDALQLELDAWCAAWGVPDLSRRITIDVSGRFVSSLGRAYYRSTSIRLHAQLLEGGRETLLREVLCHEAAHLAAHAIHGERIMPHGREWRAIFAAAGYAPRATVPGEEAALVMPERRPRRRRRRRAGAASRARRLIQWLLPF